MLDCVKMTIESLPDDSFPEFFVKYIIEVQDTFIDEEMRYLLSHNKLSVSSVGNLIENTYKELMQIC